MIQYKTYGYKHLKNVFNPNRLELGMSLYQGHLKNASIILWNGFGKRNVELTLEIN